MRSNGVIAVFFYNLQENWDFNKHNVILKGLPVLSVSAHENFFETVGDAYHSALTIEPQYF